MTKLQEELIADNLHALKHVVIMENMKIIIQY